MGFATLREVQHKGDCSKHKCSLMLSDQCLTRQVQPPDVWSMSNEEMQPPTGKSAPDQAIAGSRCLVSACTGKCSQFSGQYLTRQVQPS